VNIIVQPARKNGCTFYRLLQPYGALDDNGHNVFFMDKNEEGEAMAEAMTHADYVIVRDGGEALAEYTFSNFPDKKMVYDLDDDLWNMNPFSPAYRDYGLEEVEWNGQMLWEDGKAGFNIERNRQKSQYRVDIMEQADLVTVTTERLKDRIAEKIDNDIAVLPNVVDFELWWDLPLVDADKTRLGWSGGASHYVDWHSIKDGLPDVMDNAELVLAGHKWDGTIEDLDYEFYEWTDVEAHPYRQAALNIDIGLLPLADNEFNKHKSCVKWYEFAALGIPCVAANVPPYSDEIEHGDTGLLYDDEDEFVEYVNKLKNNPEMQEEIGEAGREWVAENRSVDVIVDEYERKLQDN